MIEPCYGCPACKPTTEAGNLALNRQLADGILPECQEAIAKSCGADEDVARALLLTFARGECGAETEFLDWDDGDWEPPEEVEVSAVGHIPPP